MLQFATDGIGMMKQCVLKPKVRVISSNVETFYGLWETLLLARNRVAHASLRLTYKVI